MKNNELDLKDLAEDIYDSVHVTKRYDFNQCLEMAAEIHKIRELKREKNVAIFAHSYVNSEILRFVADVTGDSLRLADEAKSRPEQNFMFAAVRFMAETAKLLNPQKHVYLCAEDGGCSLAASITAEDVSALRKQNPNATFVCYVNTTAAVKALCDVCVTSTNALDVLVNIPNNEIYFLPDKFMGENLRIALHKLAPQKTLNYYHGTCMVHEKFTVEEIDYWRAREKDLFVLAHPECKADVATHADFVGSTSQILKAIRETPREAFLALTECGLATFLEGEDLGKKRIVGSCSICPYMKSNTLKGITKSLENLGTTEEIFISDKIRDAALESLNKMWALSKTSRPFVSSPT